MADPSEPAADPPYQSLYRRFRPQRFADVKGQDHVIRALVNTVRDGHVAHAYLFSGPRGTGKTTTARILAMALNCEHPLDGEPDGTCASCVDIRRGASTDVQELDAASNRRIDEMRDLLSRVALGTRGRWKVYIIDEVHQLTSDAASALLKTLEEPPAHVVFVLATTDPQKVLPTIRSRTIHFDFHLLPTEVLGDLLRTINQEAGLGVPPEALDVVVRRGHGSARDALTVLDQVAAGGGVEDQSQMVSQIVDGLAERDAGSALMAVAQGMAAGRDARRLAADLLDHLRNAFLATMARGLVMLPDDAVTELAEQARRLGLAALVRAMEVIGQALADMRDSVDPRVTLEVALVRLARPDADASPAALLERIERLERGARAGADGSGSAAPAVRRPSDRGAPAPGSPGRAPLPPAPPVPGAGAGGGEQSRSGVSGAAAGGGDSGPVVPRPPGSGAGGPRSGAGGQSGSVVPGSTAGGESGPAVPRPPPVPGSTAGGESGPAVPRPPPVPGSTGGGESESAFPGVTAGGESGPSVRRPPPVPGSTGGGQSGSAVPGSTGGGESGPSVRRPPPVAGSTGGGQSGSAVPGSTGGGESGPVVPRPPRVPGSTAGGESGPAVPRPPASGSGASVRRPPPVSGSTAGGESGPAVSRPPASGSAAGGQSGAAVSRPPVSGPGAGGESGPGAVPRPPVPAARLGAGGSPAAEGAGASGPSPHRPPASGSGAGGSNRESAPSVPRPVVPAPSAGGSGRSGAGGESGPGAVPRPPVAAAPLGGDQTPRRPPGGRPEPSAGAGAGRSALPSRDELTLAWGDGVLRGLSPKAKAYVANGRFVSVGPEAAVFALPNQHLLDRSRDAQMEAEAALAARFGRPVPLRLVVESAAVASPEAEAAAESEEELLRQGDLDHLQDADVAVISPEQRLMDAFPGAEEVST